jgi:hypothetical protein
VRSFPRDRPKKCEGGVWGIRKECQGNAWGSPLKGEEGQFADPKLSLTCGAPDDTSPLVDRFEELANDERHRLNPLHLLLRSEQLSSEVVCLIADVLLPTASGIEKTMTMITETELMIAIPTN